MSLLTGKNVLIMGIRNRWSIAWGIAKSCHEQGARLFFTYKGEREKASVEELVKEFENYEIMPCDVENEEEVKQVFAELKKSVKEVHGVVHCIAHAYKEDMKNEFLDTSKDGYFHAMDVTSYSLILVAKYAKDLMPNGGSIVTISYYGASKVMPGYNLMGAAKAALEANVRYLASEIGPIGIRVNSISSGPIKTISTREINDFYVMLEAIEKKAPLRRSVTPAEIGDSTVFLLSDLSRGITGTNLYVDNGYHIMGI
ncbi:MAG: enoyl-ACP reductase [Clostridia bacterium]|nr:enoyl-ACP reductase [Clostridia bacterium]